MCFTYFFNMPEDSKDLKLFYKELDREKQVSTMVNYKGFGKF